MEVDAGLRRRQGEAVQAIALDLLRRLAHRKVKDLFFVIDEIPPVLTDPIGV